MSDEQKNESIPRAQSNQTWYPGPGVWPGMAAPWYAAPPGWGYGHHHHHAETAQHPAMQGVPQAGWYPGAAWPGPAMVCYPAHPAQVAAGAAPAQPPSAPQAQAGETQSIFSSGLGVHNDALVKGLLIGAGVAYLLTNETVQKNVMTAAVKLWSALQGGVEEMKERFRDAEAEAHASEKR